MRISDWSSDVFSSDLAADALVGRWRSLLRGVRSRLFRHDSANPVSVKHPCPLICLPHPIFLSRHRRGRLLSLRTPAIWRDDRGRGLTFVNIRGAGGISEWIRLKAENQRAGA